ncbi:hypothetical protein DICPUDRAFT_91650 [Dictyostelium purpureum]|uniref:Profilin n=1 Tax=Dictyostelium purpureum TaxID=5786 RepID=F0ZFC0_DICPU|nr:uncharacterized protein DICPUDRAFT_91650 [Dictyostelium purpureum]EGC37382.1 hypothetical protein DICPUDRAFT_91650 [Dictyostelium purpureum]|eukprot:XP_003286123.1 hypothetical protein DICPUDRAFT_91650 [Dictyostelium purpureum]
MLVRNRNNKKNKNNKKSQQQQQQQQPQEKNKNEKSIDYEDEEDDEYSEDDEILKDLNECKTQNQMKRRIEKEKEMEEKENHFFEQIISGSLEHNYISGVAIFNYDGIVLASKNVDVSKFSKNGTDLQKYFERTPLGQCNKDIVSQCGRDLLGPGYIVEGVAKNSIYCFNNQTKCGFSLEKTKSTFILGLFNEKQDRFNAYKVIGCMADDFRGVNL